MTIATKNGSVVVKGGKLAQNCACCRQCPNNGYFGAVLESQSYGGTFTSQMIHGGRAPYPEFDTGAMNLSLNPNRVMGSFQDSNYFLTASPVSLGALFNNQQGQEMYAYSEVRFGGGIAASQLIFNIQIRVGQQPGVIYPGQQVLGSAIQLQCFNNQYFAVKAFHVGANAPRINGISCGFDSIGVKLIRSPGDDQECFIDISGIPDGSPLTLTVEEMSSPDNAVTALFSIPDPVFYLLP
jgi:hypothetical protein